MSKNSDIVKFAERVERLCDFLINEYTHENGRDGSEDLKVLEVLKEDAADLQNNISASIEGLHNYMNGVIHEPSSSGT